MNLEQQIEKSLGLFKTIDKDRQSKLEILAQYIQAKKDQGKVAQLNFICTHNSRRSHFGQMLSAIAAWHFGVKVQTWSGGVEVTAFNPRAIAALRRMGIHISHEQGINPHYQVIFAPEAPTIVGFSKTFDDPHNPQEAFCAIMVCSSAEQNCPFVAGAEKRIAITYEDPGNADNTPQEANTYDERARQMLTEQLFVFSIIK